jgi:hypothetical protein
MTTPAVTGMTPEQLEFAMRLEGIFMPQARKKRDALTEVALASNATAIHAS